MREGFVADLLLLDENAVGDRATFEQPHHYATRIDYVFVNGRAVVAEGKTTGQRPGQAIRRR